MHTYSSLQWQANESGRLRPIERNDRRRRERDRGANTNQSINQTLQPAQPMPLVDSWRAHPSHGFSSLPSGRGLRQIKQAQHHAQSSNATSSSSLRLISRPNHLNKNEYECSIHPFIPAVPSCLRGGMRDQSQRLLLCVMQFFWLSSNTHGGGAGASGWVRRSPIGCLAQSR